MAEKRLRVAKIATAHGIRGLVKLECYAEDPSCLENYGPLYTGERGENTLSIRVKGAHGQHLLAEIEGVSDRTQAESLRGTGLYLDRSVLPDPEEDSFYHADLLGLTVLTPEGAKIGTVRAVQNFGAGDLLEVWPDMGTTFYLPFTKENFPDIDLRTGSLVCVEDITLYRA